MGTWQWRKKIHFFVIFISLKEIASRNNSEILSFRQPIYFLTGNICESAHPYNIAERDLSVVLYNSLNRIQDKQKRTFIYVQYVYRIYTDSESFVCVFCIFIKDEIITLMRSLLWKSVRAKNFPHTRMSIGIKLVQQDLVDRQHCVQVLFSQIKNKIRKMQVHKITILTHSSNNEKKKDKNKKLRAQKQNYLNCCFCTSYIYIYFRYTYRIDPEDRKTFYIVIRPNG